MAAPDEADASALRSAPEYLAQALALEQAGRLVEADRCFEQGIERFPDDLDLAQAYASAAQGRGDQAQAIRRWGAVKSQFPALPHPYVIVADLLAATGRFDEAEVVLSPAVRSFPDNYEVNAAMGRLAMQRGDRQASIALWSTIGAKFPEVWHAHLHHASALAAADQVAEAEAVLVSAMDRFPDIGHLAMNYARLAEQRMHHREAISRWRSVEARHGASGTATSAIIAQLQFAGENDLAEAEVEQALAADPTDLEVLGTYSVLAVRRHDWEEALRRWRIVQERLPDHPLGYIGEGGVLRDLGRFEEADALLTKALERFPADMGLEIERAQTATSARNWRKALSYWETVRRRHPHNSGLDLAISMTVAAARLDLAIVEDGEPTFEIPEILSQTNAQGDREALRDLFMQFESLGDDCEFGMVQRRFGAEPLSLLRWTYTPVDKLAEALHARFAGVGDPEHTKLDNPKGELLLRVARYQMYGHTFTFGGTVDHEAFYRQQCRRMQFLSRKLIEDLEAADKIFLYKTTSNLDEDKLSMLHEAVASYGSDTALLYVRLCDDAHPAGSVTLAKPTLLVGYIEHFSTSDISTNTWVKLCTTSKALFDERRAAGALAVA